MATDKKVGSKDRVKQTPPAQSIGTKCGLTKRVSPHGKITAVSMMKDEGPFLLEWIAHHLAVGFTDIVVYTNDCSDGTDKMLMRLEELGLAYHRVNAIPEGQRPQPSALNYAQEEPVIGDSDWALVFDADEFLCIKYGDGTLDDLLSATKALGANGIVITWRIFGSGGVHHWSRDPVTEQYLYAAPPMWNKGWGVKTLFQFDPEKWKFGIHRPKMKNRWIDTEFPDSIKWLNGSGRPMEDYFRFRGWRSIVRTIGYDWVQMNHYAVKSIDSYAIRKFRGNVNFKKDKYNSDYWALQDRNEVRDDAMLRYTAERNRIVAELLKDPELNRLHFAALARAEARLAEFKGTEAYEELVAGLKAASAIPITQVEAKPPQARDPEKIAALMSDMEKRVSGKRKEELKKPPEDRTLAPIDLYVREEVDMSAEPPMEWFANHEIDIPGDPRVFTPQALLFIQAGKFERNTARMLPRVLAQGSRHAEIGCGCGFMGAHLSRVRPDLDLFLHEQSPALGTVLSRIWARRGIEVGPRLHLETGGISQEAESLAAYLRNVRADSLQLGDPALTAETLRQAMALADVAAPSRILITGRLLVTRYAELADFETLFREWGLVERIPLDASTSFALQRPGTPIA